MNDSERREREWLEGEVARAASLSDGDRILILRDLLRTLEAIRSAKSPQELAREEEVRRILEEEPGRARYLACIARCG